MAFDQELLRRQMEVSIAPPKPRTTRGIVLPPPGKTIQDMEPRPPKKKSLKGPIAAALAASVLFGTLGTHQYLENPESFNPQAIMRDITSFPGAVLNKVLDISKGFNWFKKEEIVVPDTFDPTAKKGVIGENNSVDIPVDETKTEVDNGIASIPLLIRLPEGYTGGINYELINAFGVKREGQPVNNQLRLSNMPVGTEIISLWDGKINQGSGNSPVFNDGSWEDLQGKIVAKDDNGHQFGITLSTGRVRDVIANLPNTNGYPILENDSVPAIPIKKGDVIAVIASSANSKWFDGQISLTIGGQVGAVNIQIPTQDGKAITLQGTK